MPTDAIFAVGTRSVILSFVKLITNNSSVAPAITSQAALERTTRQAMRFMAA